VAILDCQTVLRARAVMEAIGRCIDSTTKPLPCLRRMFLDTMNHFVESDRRRGRREGLLQYAPPNCASRASGVEARFGDS
jgi:hypothetical protein